MINQEKKRSLVLNLQIPVIRIIKNPKILLDLNSIVKEVKVNLFKL